MNTKKNSVSVLQVNFDDKKLINKIFEIRNQVCLLYTSDAADEV